MQNYEGKYNTRLSGQELVENKTNDETEVNNPATIGSKNRKLAGIEEMETLVENIVNKKRMMKDINDQFNDPPLQKIMHMVDTWYKEANIKTVVQIMEEMKLEENKGII